MGATPEREESGRGSRRGSGAGVRRTSRVCCYGANRSYVLCISQVTDPKQRTTEQTHTYTHGPSPSRTGHLNPASRHTQCTPARKKNTHPQSNPPQRESIHTPESIVLSPPNQPRRHFPPLSPLSSSSCAVFIPRHLSSAVNGHSPCSPTHPAPSPPAQQRPHPLEPSVQRKQKSIQRPVTPVTPPHHQHQLTHVLI
jgi:hypothetical protein